MSVRTAFVRISLSSLERNLQSNPRYLSSISLQNVCSTSAHYSSLRFVSFLPPNRGLGFHPFKVPSRSYGHVGGAISLDNSDSIDDSTLEPPDDSSKDTVEQLLLNKDDATKIMKMERRSGFYIKQPIRWFPYLDEFKAGGVVLNSGEVLEALDSLIMEVRKERFRHVAKNRTYSVCLVVEGLSDFGNVSAVFRSADALGFQSVHVISCDSKRYRDNRHVSKGAEKWLDIELWNSTQECFQVLKSRGYRIATTHVGIDAVSIYDMDWSCPTAIVVGNENRGITEEALQLSDLHCSIPMKGMVDSFNVSVAAGILMHHAVCDRISRLGHHGDLTSEENQILLAEFSLRHSKSAIGIANVYAKRKAEAMLTPKLLEVHTDF